MDRKLGFLALIPFFITIQGCKSTLVYDEGSYTPEVWSEAKQGHLPNLSSDEFNEQRDTYVGLLEQYKQSGTALFDNSTFIECTLSDEQKSNISTYDQTNNNNYVTSNIVINATPDTCLRFQNGDRSNVSFHHTAKTSARDGSSEVLLEAYTTISGDVKKHFMVINSKVGNSHTTSIRTLAYNKGDSEVSFSQINNSPTFTTTEIFKSTSNENVTAIYDGELLSTITVRRQNERMPDGYSEGFGATPYEFCTKGGEYVDISKCLEPAFSSDANRIVNSLKNKPTSIKISEAVFIAPKVIEFDTGSSTSNRESSFDFWAVGLSAAAVLYGIDQGLTADNASSLGAGVYDLVSEGDATKLNNTTESLKLNNTKPVASNKSEVSTGGFYLSKQEAIVDESFRDINYYDGKGETVPANKLVPPCVKFRPVIDFQDQYIKECLSIYPEADNSCVTQASLKADHVWMKKYGHVFDIVCPGPQMGAPLPGNSVDK